MRSGILWAASRSCRGVVAKVVALGMGSGSAHSVGFARFGPNPRVVAPTRARVQLKPRLPPVHYPAGAGVRIGANRVVTDKIGLAASGGKAIDKKIAREVACNFLAACSERRTMCRIIN